MRLTPFATSRKRRQWLLLAALSRSMTPFYRLTFLAAASRHGLLKRLALGEAAFETLAEEMAPEPETHEALRAWLDSGVALGILKHGVGGYALRGNLPRWLASLDNDAFAAFAEEIVTLHHRLLLETPARVQHGRSWSLQEQDGPLIARSSRVLEVLVEDTIAERMPRSGSLRLLEVGCGSGTYIRTAARLNPELTATGIELQPKVAAAARANLTAWHLDDRATVLSADIRDLPASPDYDLVTLYNNIYYFPVGDREALFRHLRGFLRPGGRILVITPCLGGTPAIALLNLWAASTQGCGRLPTVPELKRALAGAGFAHPTAWTLLPGVSVHGFEASVPP